MATWARRTVTRDLDASPRRGRKTVHRFLRDMRTPLGGLLPVVVAAIVVVIDLTTRIQLNVPILYGVPLIVAAWTRNRRALWTLGVVLAGTTFVVYWAEMPAATVSMAEPLFVDRLLACAAILIITALLHVWTEALDAVEAQAELLRRQNNELDAANRELRARGDLIVRQNEELERRRRDAEDASMRKTQILKSVSHDIRTPLQTISVIAEVIRRTAEDSALVTGVGRLTRHLQANAIALNELVANVLDAAAFDSGHVVVHDSEFSLAELMSQECARILPLAQAKGLRLTCHLPAPSAWLRTDQPKLARVLTNLLSNAIKFTPEGEVTVACAVTANEVELSVQDTGIGIAPDDRQRIFDEFTQARSLEGHGGWGLGLAICRRLVDALGGVLTAQSEPGVGTVFVVRLPASCVVQPPVAVDPRREADGAAAVAPAS